MDRTPTWDYLFIHFPQPDQVTLQGRGRTKGVVWSVFEQMPGSLSIKEEGGLVGVNIQ